MLEFVAFYLFSALILFCFSVVVITNNLLYAMSALASGMIFISGIFFLRGAEFLGVVQIAVYTGAVMSLYAFGMMFFDSSKEVKEKIKGERIKGFLIFGVAVIFSLVLILPILGDRVSMQGSAGNTQDIGMVLFTKYLLIFEVVAVMLLIAMIAGITLASRKEEDGEKLS